MTPPFPNAKARTAACPKTAAAMRAVPVVASPVATAAAANPTAAADSIDAMGDIRCSRFISPGWLTAALLTGASAASRIAAAAAAANPTTAADPNDAMGHIRGPRFISPNWLTAALLAGASAGSHIAAAAAAAADSEDIRDIRGPRFVWPGWLTAALLAGGVLLAVLGYLVWRWLRRRRRPRVLAPFEVALRRLEEIRPLMQPHTVRAFSIAASDIVRSYIELRFDVTATHLTTEEFLHDLLTSSRAALLRHRALLAEFLQQCDLVKFAGMSLTLHDIESLHQSARAFVLETAKPDTNVSPVAAVNVGSSAAADVRPTAAADLGPSAAPPQGAPPAGPRAAHNSLPST